MLIYPVATALVGWVLRSWHLRRAGELAALELAATRERLAAIVEAAPVAVVAVDLEGRVTEWSPAAERMFGWTREEVLGSLNPIVPEGEREVSAELTRLALESNSLCAVELERLRKDGSSIRVRLSNAAIQDSSGAPTGVMAVLEDVTERSELEAQLRQAQKMEAIGRLAGGIAHDFNNLLQALLSSTQAQRLRGTHPEVEPFLEDVQTHLERGVSLARQLLLFSRQAPSRREHVDLGRLVADHVSMLRHLLPETVEMAIDVPEVPIPVRADAGQLGQVLTNLVVNARDAMPRGGRLEITVAVSAGEVMLEAADTGDGIPAELIDRIFDPFFTTKPLGQGSGLGLAVVWGIVNEHGGRIEVESEPGRGSSFRVLLPMSPGPAEVVAHSPVVAAPPSGRGERILLVEDEQAAREGLTELLSALGFSVVAVASGAEAEALPEAPRFDLLLTDYLLPGAHGLEVARSLSARWPDLKVVVMSGYAPGFIGDELGAGNGIPFLQKPFDMATLAQTLKTSLGG